MSDVFSTPCRWREVTAMLADFGLALRRQPPPRPGAAASHKAEWHAAGRLPCGDRVWIRVLHYADTIAWRWQVTAYRARSVYLGRLTGDREQEQARVLLHDPTPLQALAAAAVLGLTVRQTVPGPAADAPAGTEFAPHR